MNKIKEMAEKYVEERRDLDVGHANAQFNCFDMIDAVKFGANAVLEEINNKINRSFLEDFEGMDEHDREIAQGAIAMVNIWIQQLKGE